MTSLNPRLIVVLGGINRSIRLSARRVSDFGSRRSRQQNAISSSHGRIRPTVTRRPRRFPTRSSCRRLRTHSRNRRERRWLTSAATAARQGYATANRLDAQPEARRQARPGPGAVDRGRRTKWFQPPPGRRQELQYFAAALRDSRTKSSPFPDHHRRHRGCSTAGLTFRAETLSLLDCDGRCILAAGRQLRTHEQAALRRRDVPQRQEIDGSSIDVHVPEDIACVELTASEGDWTPPMGLSRQENVRRGVSTTPLDAVRSRHSARRNTFD